MCGPAAAVGIMAASSLMQGYAQYQQARYASKVASQNAAIADRLAVDAEKRGVAREEAYRRNLAATQGQQRAALAASGADLSSGSALDLQGDIAQFGELDALSVRANAEREAYGFRTQGMNFRAESEARKAGGNYALLGSVLQATSHIVGNSGKFKTQQTYSPTPLFGTAGPL